MIIYGRNVVREAIKARLHIKRAYILDSSNLSREMKQTENELRHLRVPVEKVKEEKLKNITHSKDHQGIAAKINDYKYADTLKTLDHLEHPPFVVILDQVQDPHNVGAIIRSAYGAGVDLLILPKRGGCLVTPAVLKTSAGYAFRLSISVETNLARVIEELKKRGIWVYAATMKGKPYYDIDMTGPIAFIFGNEGKGVRRLVMEKSDGFVSIPMARKMNSLNVSVSVAVILFRAMEMRNNANP